MYSNHQHKGGRTWHWKISRLAKQSEKKQQTALVVYSSNSFVGVFWAGKWKALINYRFMLMMATYFGIQRLPPHKGQSTLAPLGRLGCRQIGRGVPGRRCTKRRPFSSQTSRRISSKACTWPCFPRATLAINNNKSLLQNSYVGLHGNLYYLA